MLEPHNQEGTNFLQAAQGTYLLNNATKGSGLMVGPLQLRGLFFKPLRILLHPSDHMIKRGTQFAHLVVPSHLDPHVCFPFVDFLRGLGQFTQGACDSSHEEEASAQSQEKDN